ncbi:type II secretion system F family protein [Vibrio salinus]|uniref:type II secretion system F family protein n=1 Tax=Vibrio salinus TaxID=2899784 RepID=UPI001E2A735F|nr:type II secretion system F family protein [Vibrio salinus]MCE0493378.1 type II secretion system F family protein [Vibrio salinus]
MNKTIKYFRWTGIKHGKKMKGVSVDFTPEALQIKLQKQHIYAISLKETPRFLNIIQHTGLTRQQLLIFTRQLTTTINANMPLLSSLEMMTGQQQPVAIQKILIRIEQSIQNGSTLSSAMKASHPYLQGTYADLIEIGEISGKLPDCLQKLSMLIEQQQHIKAKIIKASIYPGFVLLTSIIVTYLMLTNVVPEFSKIYASMHAQLPAFTNTLIHLSDLMQTYGLLGLLTISCLIGIGRLSYVKHPTFRCLVQGILFKLPIVGLIIFKADIARTMQTLFTCYSSGIPIMECLNMAQKSVSTDKFRQVLKQISFDMETGQPLNLAMSKQLWFPVIVEQMVHIGESSGTLSPVFEKLANDYTNQINDTVDNLGKIIEPIVVLLIGTLVGGIVIAMYLPIFNLMNMLG